MQSPSSTTLLVLFICCLSCFSTQVSSIHTLEQEPDSLNSSSQLVSANGDFTLGFYTPPNTNNTYLALWFSNPSYFKLVWIGNRDNPIPTNSSPVLAIGSRGEMTVNHNGGDPVELFGGGPQQQNVTATLMDSGNFVVTTNESSNFLWQSFDYPTDTLLSGMKIGTDHTSGKNWTLTSWSDRDNPAPGAFTLEWDPSVSNFLVRRRGEVYWRSGELKYYTDEEGNSRVELSNFNFNRDPINFYFNFTIEREGYLIFTVTPHPAFPPKVTSGWKLDDMGDIYDIDKALTIARPSLCNDYHQRPADLRGCESRGQPESGSKGEKKKQIMMIIFVVVGSVVLLILP